MNTCVGERELSGIADKPVPRREVGVEFLMSLYGLVK
jgi:hypothetical protein